jgi:hypothetical protein
MKKFFTLLFAVGMFTMAQAQPGSRDNRQNDQRNDQRNDQQNDQQYDQRNNRQMDQRDFNDGYDNNGFDKNGRYFDKFSMEKRKRMEIARINQEFDYKIQKVKRTFFLSWFEKQRQIRSLEQQRQWEIRKVEIKYTYSRKPDFGRDNRHDNRSNGHY